MQKLLDFRDLQTNAENVGGLVFLPVSVGGCYHSAIWKDLDARISTIATLVVFLEQDAKVPRGAFYQVVVMAHPGHPTVCCWTGITLAWDISERDKESPVRKVLSRMPISGQGIGQGAWLGPGGHLIAAENNVRIGFPPVLA